MPLASPRIPTSVSSLAALKVQVCRGAGSVVPHALPAIVEDPRRSRPGGRVVCRRRRSRGRRRDIPILSLGRWGVDLRPPCTTSAIGPWTLFHGKRFSRRKISLERTALPLVNRGESSNERHSAARRIKQCSVGHDCTTIARVYS